MQDICLMLYCLLTTQANITRKFQAHKILNKNEMHHHTLLQRLSLKALEPEGGGGSESDYLAQRS